MNIVKTKKTALQVKSQSKTVVLTTIKEMVERLSNLKSTTFVQLWQKTPNLNLNKNKKTDGSTAANPFDGKVKKCNCVNAVINYDYENMVNNARSKEALTQFNNRISGIMEDAGIPEEKIKNFIKSVKSDVTDNVEQFKAEANNVGQYIPGSKCIMRNSPESGQWAGVDGYYIQLAALHSARPVYKWNDTGEILTEDEVTHLKQWAKPIPKNSRQGLEKPYIIKAFRFETIEAITLNGVKYQIQH